MLLGAIALLITVSMLLLRSAVLLALAVIALLMLGGRRVRRSVSVWVVLALLWDTIALLWRLAVGMVGRRGILALSLGVGTVSLVVLAVRLLSIRLALRRIALICGIPLLLLVRAIVAVAMILAMTLAFTVAIIVVTGHDVQLFGVRMEAMYCQNTEDR